MPPAVVVLRKEYVSVEEQEEISKYIAKELTIICNKNEQERPLLLQELEKYLGEKKLGFMLVQEGWRRKKEEIKKPQE